MKKKKEKPCYNIWQNSAYMIKFAWKVRKAVLFLCLLSAGMAVIRNVAELLIGPMILQKIETAAPMEEVLWTILGFVSVLLIVVMLQGYMQWNMFFIRISPRIRLTMDISKKQMTTAYPNTESSEIQEKKAKALDTTSNNRAATEEIYGTWENLVKNIAGFLIYFSMIAKLKSILVGIILLTTIAGYALEKYFQKWGYEHRKEEAQYQNRIRYLNRKAEDRKIAKDIRIFGMKDWLEDVYRSTMNLFEAFLWKKEKRYLCASVIIVLLTACRNGAAYVYLLSMALHEGLPASEFLLYFSAVSGFSGWITGILSGFSKLHRQSLELSTLREYLETPEPFLYEEGERLQAEKKAYELRMKNVSFRYPGAKEDTLHNINLTIKPGEKLAIVGLNGAGKTTLVKLLCGLYDPTEGQVLLNGEDIRKYNRMDYYKMFSTVFQQFSVLEAKVKENVAQCVENIDIGRVKDCIAKAGLTEKIESLPEGYETYVGRLVFEDGVELSGGEMQRLMLARALYREAPMLILDEPTAALDPIAENDIYLKYSDMTTGRTSVFISHRLASTRFCDRILFMAEGKIAEEGTHEELLKKQGNYAELYQVQSKYYQEGRAF